MAVSVGVMGVAGLAVLVQGFAPVTGGMMVGRQRMRHRLQHVTTDRTAPGVCRSLGGPNSVR